VQIKYKTLYTLVRTRFRTKLIEFHLRWFTMGGYDLAPKTPYPEST
jgi:hypothetical protein